MMFHVLCLFLLGIYKSTLGAHEGGRLRVGVDPAVIQREALALLLPTEHTQPGEEHRVFPGLVNITCSGSISSLVFIARNNATDTAPGIAFSFWRPLQLTGRNFEAKLSDFREQDIELVLQPSWRDDIALYRAKFSPPLQFKSGDMLAIDQALGGLSIQYAYNWGPENFVKFVTESIASSFVSTPLPVQDYPLLALDDYDCEACPVQCVKGLLSTKDDLEHFLAVNFNPKVTTPFLQDPNISPLLRFTNIGSITKWSITGTTDELPQLQVWRANSSSGRLQYQRVMGSSTTSDVVTASPAKTFINQEISFQEGDILAVVSSSDRVVLGDIILSSDNYGASGFEPGDTDTEFEAGVIIIISLFIDLDTSDDGSETSQAVAEHIIADPTYNITGLDFHSDIHGAVPQFVVPHNGMLTRWMYAAKLYPTLDHLQKPQLQVWRKEPNAFLDTLILVQSSNASLESTSRNNLGIFEYVLDEPALVKAGDILGFYQPSREESQLQLAFVSNTETAVYELLLIQSEPFLLAENRSSAINTSSPMISVEILPDEDLPVGSSTSSPTSTPTSSSDELLTRNEIIFTAAVGLFIIIAGAVLICMILVCCSVKMTREKKRRSRSSIYGLPRKTKSDAYATGVYLKSYKTYKTSFRRNHNNFQFVGNPVELVDGSAEMKFDFRDV